MADQSGSIIHLDKIVHITLTKTHPVLLIFNHIPEDTMHMYVIHRCILITYSRESKQ